jgi:hypothetical protein
MANKKTPRPGERRGAATLHDNSLPYHGETVNGHHIWSAPEIVEAVMRDLIKKQGGGL